MNRLSRAHERYRQTTDDRHTDGRQHIAKFAKTAEPIEMPFGVWAGIVPRNHVLDGASAVLTDVAMATNFGMQFAITGFV